MATMLDKRTPSNTVTMSEATLYFMKLSFTAYK